jgi:hypothetical protein
MIAFSRFYIIVNIESLHIYSSKSTRFSNLKRCTEAHIGFSKKPGVMVYICNLSTQETEAGES